MVNIVWRERERKKTTTNITVVSASLSFFVFLPMVTHSFFLSSNKRNLLKGNLLCSLCFEFKNGTQQYSLDSNIFLGICILLHFFSNADLCTNGAFALDHHLDGLTLWILLRVHYCLSKKHSTVKPGQGGVAWRFVHYNRDIKRTVHYCYLNRSDLCWHHDRGGKTWVKCLAVVDKCGEICLS